jgi:hypothetical protein
VEPTRRLTRTAFEYRPRLYRALPVALLKATLEEVEGRLTASPIITARQPGGAPTKYGSSRIDDVDTAPVGRCTTGGGRESRPQDAPLTAVETEPVERDRDLTVRVHGEVPGLVRSAHGNSPPWGR